MSARPERCGRAAQPGPARPGPAGRCVNALLTESQMAHNMLPRLGKHWQIRPQSRSGCQLEDMGVLGVPVQGATSNAGESDALNLGRFYTAVTCGAKL